MTKCCLTNKTLCSTLASFPGSSIHVHKSLGMRLNSICGIRMLDVKREKMSLHYVVRRKGYEEPWRLDWNRIWDVRMGMWNMGTGQEVMKKSASTHIHNFLSNRSLGGSEELLEEAHSTKLLKLKGYQHRVLHGQVEEREHVTLHLL